MELIKRSIFKIRTYECDIKFAVYSLRDGLSYPQPFKIRNGTHTEEKVVINIPSPLLSVGDKLYLEDTDTFLSVEEVIRTDKDNVCYIVENLNHECISEKSKVEYENDKQAFLDITTYKNYKNEVETIKRQIKEAQREVSESNCFSKNKRAYDLLMSFKGDF